MTWLMIAVMLQKESQASCSEGSHDLERAEAWDTSWSMRTEVEEAGLRAMQVTSSVVSPCRDNLGESGMYIDDVVIF